MGECRGLCGICGNRNRHWRIGMENISWDAVLEGHLAAERRRVLASARIGMAGAGGLGSNCAVFLARTGIRHFVIADPDVVALSNLNRQHFFPRHLGLSKVEALGDVLRELNPSIALRLERRALDGAAARALFAGCDVVVEAVDDPGTKKTLVEALLLGGFRVVSASGMAGWGGAPMTARRLGGRLVVVGDHTSEIGPGMPPLAPRVVMAAALEADAVLEMLLGRCGKEDQGREGETF